MKSTHGQSILLYLLASWMVFLSGCSETTKEAEPQPDIVFPVTFPLINDSKLYSVEANAHFGLPAKDGNSSAYQLSEELLLEIPTGLLLTLDTDPSDKSSVDGVDTFTNTALPEYLAYVDADKQTLRLYDLDTRHNHELYSFTNDPLIKTEIQINEDEDVTFIYEIDRFICDIQKVVTWDDEARLAKKVLFKDELAVYVKTSTISDCSQPQEGFEYWQINIVESSEEPFKIRRKTLKQHTHEHRHLHDHDNPDYEYADLHNHDHLLEEGERDENGEPFNPKDHTHKHTHTHDFIYSFQHEHEHLSQDEIDAVHNDTLNHEVVIESHPFLIGRKTTFTSLDEALMYSGEPVIDLDARTFGYLGLNGTESAFKFFEVNLDTLEKRLLWSAQSENLSNTINTPWKNTNWHALVPRQNRFINYSDINGYIVVATHKNLFVFTKDNLFDDDAVEERANSLASPLFTSSYSDPRIWNRTHYNDENHKMVIAENNQVWQVDFEEAVPKAALLKTFNDTNLVSIEAKMMASEIMVIKRFENNETTFTSITAIQESGIEVGTILNKTEDSISVFNQGPNSFLNIRSSDPDQQLSARFLLSDFGSPFSLLTDTLWLQNTLDYRSMLEKQLVSQISSENLSAIPGTLEEPEIYLFEIIPTPSRGENIGNIPDAVRDVSSLVLFNDQYTILEYQNSNNEIWYRYLINAFN